MNSRFVLFCLLTAVFSLSSSGCGLFGSGDKVAGSGGPVTITGVVATIDSGRDVILAKDIKVYLLDNETKVVTSSATGTDGSFSLQVAGGSKAFLVTDDFTEPDTGGIFTQKGSTHVGTYVPLINDLQLRIEKFEASQDVGMIHAALNTTGNDQGLISALNQYFSEGTPQLFEATSTLESRGAMIWFLHSTSGALEATQGVTLSSNKKDCPVGYIDGDHLFDIFKLKPDPLQDPDGNIFYPASQTTTDEFGASFVFCSEENSFNLTISEVDFSGIIGDDNEIKVEVREGHITLVFGGSIDGVTGKTFQEVLTASGDL